MSPMLPSTDELQKPAQCYSYLRDNLCMIIRMEVTSIASFNVRVQELFRQSHQYTNISLPPSRHSVGGKDRFVVVQYKKPVLVKYDLFLLKRQTLFVNSSLKGLGIIILLCYCSGLILRQFLFFLDNFHSTCGLEKCVEEFYGSPNQERMLPF